MTMAADPLNAERTASALGFADAPRPVEPPRLADGVELLDEYKDSGYSQPPSLVRRADGQVIQVSPLLYRVACRIDGSRDPDAIAALVSADLGRSLNADQVRYLITAKLLPLGVLAAEDVPAALPKANPLLALRARGTLLPERAVNVVAAPLRPLFRWPVVVAVTGSMLAVDYWLFAVHGLGGGIQQVLRDPLDLLVVLGLSQASALFHECGHATGCRYGGARPGVIGVGIYLVWPSFFTNVTDSYRLSRASRLRTDLGGLYFNLIFMLALAGIYAATSYEMLLLVIAVTHLEMLGQLLPFVRFDGYFILSDLGAVSDGDGLGAETFVARRGSHEAGTPEENYPDPGLAARPKPPYSGGDRSDYRRGAWFRFFDVIAGVVLLAELPLLAVLTGQLHVRPFLSYVHQSVGALTLPAFLGFIIAITMTGVVVGCVVYRLRTRYRRITPGVPWGSFEGRSLDYGPPSLPCSRSGTFWGRVVISLIILIVVAALTITTLFSWRGLLSSPIVLSYWLLANCTLLFCMLAFLIGRRFNDHPVAAGQVAAIVPAYDEDPEELRAVVHSILGQSMPPEMVYVVDDGSKVPVGQPFYHPKVTWLRKENGGKRSAQVYALDHMNRADWDFILTVDGDSILDRYALEHQLRAFSRGGRRQRRYRRSRVIAGGAVMATTGMVLVRNRKYNLLTRLADMNIGTSCVMMRASRSLLGTLETTSGALAVYRAHILFKHKERYLNGTYGDDRALAMYSALEGEVVGVNEAVVWSAMPTNAKLTYKQRLRWSKSWWCMIPFVLTNMMRFRQMFFPLFGLTQLAIAPLTLAYIAFYSLWSVAHDSFHADTLLLYASAYLVVRYAMTALYMVERPGMRLHQRFLTWFLLTPLEAIYNLVFLNPTKYIALVKLRDHHWGTRGAAVQMTRAKKFLFIAAVTLGISAVPVSIGGAMWAGAMPLSLPPPPANHGVLNNNASAGSDVFTFDDGPDIHTLQLVSELHAEHIHAIFFAIGYKVSASPRVVEAEVKAGDLVEVHTWDHKDITGYAMHTTPLTASQVRQELVKCINAIVAAGAPRPTMWRPPFGDVNPMAIKIADSLGLRLVMPWSDNGTITDDGDWQVPVTAAEILRNTTLGWPQGSQMRGGLIIAGHDGSVLNTPYTIAAMPGIVRYMNAHHIGATLTLPHDTTGGDLINAGHGTGSG